MIRRFLSGATLGVELVYLGYLLWRQLDPDAPSPTEILELARGRLASEAAYREAIRRTLDSIRSLPETGE